MTGYLNEFFHTLLSASLVVLLGTVVLEFWRPGFVILYVPLVWILAVVGVSALGVVFSKNK